jgi:hypothetical protein
MGIEYPIRILTHGIDDCLIYWLGFWMRRDLSGQILADTENGDQF